MRFSCIIRIYIIDSNGKTSPNFRFYTNLFYNQTFIDRRYTSTLLRTADYKSQTYQMVLKTKHWIQTMTSRIGAICTVHDFLFIGIICIFIFLQFGIGHRRHKIPTPIQLYIIINTILLPNALKLC